jgi:demethylmenaquinone methyltransferase/2-methoxy-6-polyprenyl-1,4-benzoquinol methylase
VRDVFERGQGHIVNVRRQLEEQIQYYRARAGEYDDWFFRRGRFDRGADATRQWFAEVDEVRGVLDGIPLDGADVLELAPGTGLWTERLCTRASSVLAVDASPEMVELNGSRLGAEAAKVTYVIADLFVYEPPRSFDAVVFAFWISHVPEQRLAAFARMVAAACRPGGWVFFVDNLREPTSTASDHRLPEPGDSLARRQLDDGREFTVVKNFWSTDRLESMFADAGVSLQVRQTATYLQYGVGRRTVGWLSGRPAMQ